MTDSFSEMTFEDYQAELRRLDALVSEQAAELASLECALAEISELAGPGGDDTPKGRVESLLCALTARNEGQAAEVDRLCDEVARHSEMLFKTVRRLKRICYAIVLWRDDLEISPDEVLAAVQEWVSCRDVDWLNPPPEVAKILGGD